MSLAGAANGRHGLRLSACEHQRERQHRRDHAAALTVTATTSRRLRQHVCLRRHRVHTTGLQNARRSHCDTRERWRAGRRACGGSPTRSRERRERRHFHAGGLHDRLCERATHRESGGADGDREQPGEDLRQHIQFHGSEFTPAGLQNGETIGTVTLTSAGAPPARMSGSSYAIAPSAASGGTFTPGTTRSPT